MNEVITVEGKEYISVKRASEITKYSKDYIGQLCRAGKILSIMPVRTWWIDEASLLHHQKTSEEAVRSYAKKIYTPPAAPVSVAPVVSAPVPEPVIVQAPVRAETPIVVKATPVVEAAPVAAVVVPVAPVVKPTQVFKSPFIYENDNRPLIPELKKAVAVKQPVSVRTSVAPKLSSAVVSVKPRMYAKQIALAALIIGFTGGSVFAAMNSSAFMDSVARVGTASVAAVENGLAEIGGLSSIFAYKHSSALTTNSSNQNASAIGAWWSATSSHVASIVRSWLGIGDNQSTGLAVATSTFDSIPYSNGLAVKATVPVVVPTKIVVATSSLPATSVSVAVSTPAPVAASNPIPASAPVAVRTQTVYVPSTVTNTIYQTDPTVSARVDQLQNDLDAFKLFESRQTDTIFESIGNHTSSSGGGGGSGSVTSVGASGGTTGLTFGGGPVTSTGVLTLSGVLNTANGGTGTSTYSTGDLLYGNNSNGLSVLPAASNGLVLKLQGGVPIWAVDLMGSGGAGAWATTSDGLAVYPSDPTQTVIIGSNATTSTGTIFEVVGNSKLGGTTQTNNLIASNFSLGSLNGPLQANNGVVSATTSVGVLYGGTGLASAPGLGNILVGNSTGGYTFTSTSSLGLPQFSDLSAYLTSAIAASTYLTQANAASTYLSQANAASTYLTQANAASTYLTSVLAASTYLSQANFNALDKGFFFSTTSAQAFLALNQGNAFSTTSAFAFLTVNRDSAFSTSSASYFLAQNLGSAFSTTSVDFWKTQRDFFSTTSAQAFLALNQGNAFSTTSSIFFLGQNQGLAFSTSSANAYINASSTIAHPAGGLAGNLIQWDGTKWISVATSTLGLTAIGGAAYPFALAGNATSTLTQFNGGLTAYASSTIGNGSQVGGLTVNGGATTTLGLTTGGDVTSGGNVLATGYYGSNNPFGVSYYTGSINGTGFFMDAGGLANNGQYGIHTGGGGGSNYLALKSGNVDRVYVDAITGNFGIGTTTPWRALSVVGSSDLGNNALAGSFTATSSTASTFPYASTTALTASTVYATSLCLSTDCRTIWPTSGGTGGGTWSTTTSQVANEAVNYSNNGTDLVTVGGTSTTTAKFFFDPNAQIGYFSGNVGVGTTSPYAQLSVAGRGVFDQDVRADYFTSVSNSKASTFTLASTTQLTVSNTAYLPGSGIWNSAGEVGIGTMNAGGGTKLVVNTNTSSEASQGVIRSVASGTTGNNYGMVTLATGASTLNVGLYANADNAATNYGIQIEGPGSAGVNNYALYADTPAKSYFQGSVGIGTTSPWRTLSVNGNSDLGTSALAGFFTATSTSIASTFPYASTTALSATTLYTTSLCLSTDCRTAWPASYPFALAGNATSTLTQFNGGLTAYASTTIGNGNQNGGLTISGGATTTGAAYFATNVSVGTTNQNAKLDVAASNNTGVHVSTPDQSIYALSLNNNTFSSDPFHGFNFFISDSGIAQLMNNNIVDLSLSSTGGVSVGSSYVNTDAGAGNMIVSGKVGIGTTSPYAKLAVDGRGVFNQDIRADYFTATSTTKASTFTYASTTVLSASTLCLSTDCRTAWPAFAYEFGLPGNATSTLTQFNGGLTAYASTTIGNGTQTGGLTINGGATTTGNGYFGGNVGIGTTTPWAQLSVNPSGLSGPAFAVGSSSYTDFIVANNGNVGIGTTSPFATFSVQGTPFGASANKTARPGFAAYGGYYDPDIILHGGDQPLQGDGGTVNIIGGLANAGGANGGSINLTSGVNSTTGHSGNINIIAADTLSGATQGDGGNVVINAGLARGLFGGNNGTIELATNGGSVAIGSTSASSKLDITLSATSAPAITIRDPLGGPALEIRAGTSTQGNTFVGLSAGQTDTVGLANTALGYQALMTNVDGSSNTATGYQSLILNTSGSFNTATGYQTLSLNTTGASDTATGYAVLASNTTGSNNTGAGNLALQSNTSGSQNTANGARALRFNTIGSFNTATGYQSLLNLSNGQNNVALGYQSGTNVTTASSTIIIGANVSAPSASLDGQLDIGNLIYGTGLYNGNTTSSAPAGGKLGIGTTTPWRTLSVNGSSDLGTNALAGSFTATSTTATSTFAYAVSTSQLSVSSLSNAAVPFISNAVSGYITSDSGFSYITTGSVNQLRLGPAAADSVSRLSVEDGGDAGQTIYADQGDTSNRKVWLALFNDKSGSPLAAMTIGSNNAAGGQDAYGRSWSNAIQGAATIRGSDSGNLQPGAGYLQLGGSSGVSLTINSTGNVGIGTTSPYAKLAVDGRGVFNQDVRANYFTATSTTFASTFTYASTTVLSASTLCLSTDCRTAWPAFAYEFGLPGNATSTLTQFNGGLTAYASTTIGNGSSGGGLTVSGNATTTGNLTVLGIGTTTIAGGLAIATPFLSPTLTGSVVGKGDLVVGGGVSGGDEMLSTGVGSIAFGFAHLSGNSDGTIQSTNKGTLAGGAAQNGFITASGQGSVALGFADSQRPDFNYTNITASGDGSFAGGHTQFGSVIASGSGSFFWGEDGSSTASYATGFGANFQNNQANSFMVGYSAVPTLTVNAAGVGIGTTSPYAKLAVDGRGVFNQDIRADYFTATSTTFASTFIYASTTALTASTLCLSTDCRTAWPTGLSYAFPLAGNATSTLTQFNGGLTAYASSTIGNGTQVGGLTINGGATTTANAYFASNVAIGTSTPTVRLEIGGDTSAFPVELKVDATTHATSKRAAIQIGDWLGLQDSQGNGVKDFSIFGGTSFATRFLISTSGDVSLGGNAVTSPSLSALATGNVGIGTTSPYAKLAVDGRGVFNQDVRANYFTATSTTFASTFTYASTTVLSASTLCLSTDCRTAWPSAGGGAYPFALSGNATSTLTQFNGGLTAYASTTIGNGTGLTGLTVNGFSTTTGNAYFAGNIGIGTVDPTLAGAAVSKLSIIQSPTNSAIVVATTTAGTTGRTFALNPNTTGGWTIFDGGVAGSAWTAGLSQVGGKVGIGTTQPTLALSVNSASAAPASSGNATGQIAITGGGTYATVIGTFDNGTAPYSWIQGQFRDNASLTNPLDLQPIGGNVGIGTTSPYAKLAVDGRGVFNQDVRADYFTATSTTKASTFTYASTTVLSASTICISTDCRTAWPTGGGSGGGTWSTTTSQVAGRLVNYSNNNSDIVSIGSNSTTTAKFFFDPNVQIGYMSGKLGIGVASPSSVLDLVNSNISGPAITLRDSLGTASVELRAGTSTLNNTFIGVSAGAVNTTGSNNTAYGALALNQNTTGVQNAATGYEALFHNTTGFDNTATGYASMIANTTGNDNTGDGWQALQHNTTGSWNAALGGAALGANTTGSFNVGVGWNAGYAGQGDFSADVFVGYKTSWNANSPMSSTTEVGYEAGYNYAGNFSTLLGYQAGYDLASGNSNIAIGANVDLPSNTGSSQLNIGNLLYGTGIYSGSTPSSAPAGGKFGVGTTSPWRTLSVNGSSDLGINALAGSFTATSTTASSFINASTTVLSASTICLSSDCRTSWPTGGGGGSLSPWSTTTSQVSGEALTYANNNSDIVSIGSNSTTTAKFFFDPNTGTSLLGSTTGIGTSAPRGSLEIRGSGLNGVANSPNIVFSDPNVNQPTTLLLPSDVFGSIQQVDPGRGELGITGVTTFPNNPGVFIQGIAPSNLNPGVGAVSISGMVNSGPGVDYIPDAASIFSISNRDRSVFNVTGAGFVGIGTTSPYAALSVVGATGVVADHYTATSTIATSTFAGGLNVGNGALTYDYSSGVTSIANLVTGPMNFDTDAGAVSWTDLPLNSSAYGTVESYTAQLGSQSALTVFGTSDGAGGLASGPFIGIASSSPFALLSIQGPATSSTPLFAVASTTGVGQAFMISHNGTFTVNTPGATSTVNGNLYVNGTLRGTNVYSGDLIFANGFRFTEASTIDPSISSTSEGLYLKNQDMGDLMSVDKQGNLTVTGDICSNGAQCYGRSISNLTASVQALASSTAAASGNIQSAISGQSTTALSLSQLTVNLNTVSQNITDVSARVDSLASTTAQIRSLLALATSTLASSTATELASSTSFIQTISSAVKDALTTAGDWVLEKITAKLAVFDDVETKTLHAQTASVAVGLEMTDQASGQVYCVVLKNGDFVKTPGTCSTVPAATSTEQTTPTTTPSDPDLFPPSTFNDPVPSAPAAPVISTSTPIIGTSTNPVSDSAVNATSTNPTDQATSTPSTGSVSDGSSTGTTIATSSTDGAPSSSGSDQLQTTSAEPPGDASSSPQVNPAP